MSRAYFRFAIVAYVAAVWVISATTDGGWTGWEEVACGLLTALALAFVVAVEIGARRGRLLMRECPMSKSGTCLEMSEGLKPHGCPDDECERSNRDKVVVDLAATLGVWTHTCDDCSRQYVDWWAVEDLWAVIVGQYEGSLCFDCFRIRCKERGIVTVLWNATARYKLPGTVQPVVVGDRCLTCGSLAIDGHCPHEDRPAHSLAVQLDARYSGRD